MSNCRFAIIASVIVLSLTLGGCTRKVIEGDIISLTGEKLADVCVKIESSSYGAKSDAKGHYVIDYSPGSLELEFTREGYAPKTLKVSLLKKMHFPAEQVVMWPFPKAEGVYLVADTGYSALERDTVVYHTSYERSPEYITNVTLSPKKLFATVIAGSKQQRFIVALHKPVRLFKLSSEGCISWTQIVDESEFQRSGLRLELKTSFKDVVKHLELMTERNRQMVQKGVFDLWTFELGPGTYTWVEVRADGGNELSDDGPSKSYQSLYPIVSECYTFSVPSDNLAPR